MSASPEPGRATRQLWVNSFLGPSFPLGSGVTQGCPLSPLLFLIIAEPLTRLFNQNRGTYAVVSKAGNKTYRHKISLFAPSPPEALYENLWCDATSMKEDETKREILLLGLLRRHPELLGNSIVPSPLDPNTIVSDGTTIRALGVPIGNELDLEDWCGTRPTPVSPTHGSMSANESDPSSSATSRPPSSARSTHPPPRSRTATSFSL